MKVRWLVFGLAAALCVGARVHAGPIVLAIPTNQNGADVDIREHEITDNFGVTEATRQRGSVNEVTTTGQNTTVSATADRSTVAYFKFDISGLPNHVSNPGYWGPHRTVSFQLTARNTSFSNSRIVYPSPPNAELYRVKFDIHGLEPGHTYVDDGASATRTDRSGNSYSSPHYEYDWDEGTGTGIASDPNLGSGITWVDAPGITPFCMASGSCDTATYGGANTDINQSLGIFDDFNSDTRTLGTWSWPSPNEISAGSNRMAVGQPLEYVDSNGTLKQLIFDAQDAGRSKITLMMNLGVDTLLDTSSQANGPLFDGPNPGIFPANTFLNFSYAFNPKDMTTLTDDPGFDPDGSGPDSGDW